MSKRIDPMIEVTTTPAMTIAEVIEHLSTLVSEDVLIEMVPESEAVQSTGMVHLTGNMRVVTRQRDL